MADTSIAPLSSISGSSDPEAAVRVKANPKGGFSLTGDTALTAKDNAELLANMEAMIKERQSPLNLLMSGLKDAAAWGSGGIRGPSEALRSRDEQKQLEAKELFNMRSEMAARRSAQTSAESRAKSLRGEVSGGAASGVGNVAPGETAAPSRLAPPPRVVNEINRLLSLDPPDLAGAEAIQKEYIKNESKFDSTRHEQKPYYINPEIGNVTMDPEQAEYFKRTNILPDGTKVKPLSAQQTTAVSAEVPSVSTGNQPKYLNTSAAQTANKLGNTAGEFTDDELNRLASTESGKDPFALNKDTKAMGRYQFMPETVQSLHQRGVSFNPFDEKQSREVARSELNRLTKELGSKELALAAYGGFRDKDPTKYIGGILTTAPTATGKTTAPAQNVSLPSQRAELSIAKTAPAGNADLPYPVPRNAEQVNANQKFIEARGTKNLEIASKGPEQASTEAGKRRAKMFELAGDTEDTVRAADMAIAASTNHPEATGIGKGRTGANALVTVAGAVLPKMDKAKAEDQYAALMLSDEGNKAREAIVGSSKQLGIDFAANVFKGARMGIGLENMAANAKNVSEHNTAETNIINAKIIKEAALFNKSRAELYNRWAPNNGGAMANFEKFETSDEYKALAKATQEKIAAELPQYLKVGKNGLEEVNPTKKSSSENSARAELERRRKAKENQ